MNMFRVALLTGCVAGFAVAGPASAANVTFTGVVLNTCVLTISTPGLLGASSDGTTLTSETVGGLAAVLAVVSTGASPTLSFTAPALAGPTGFTGTPTVSMRFTSLSGVTQAYTSDAFTARLGQLLDTLTINAKATNTSGFISGTYTLSSTVTCQQ